MSAKKTELHEERPEPIDWLEQALAPIQARLDLHNVMPSRIMA